jgi:hypothetical protein
MVPVVLILVLAVTLGVVGVLFARSETGRRLLDGSDDSSGAALVSIRRAQAFDPPPGDRHEHDEELANLFDGNPATVWNTERYGDNRFGGLKEGVGFALEVAGGPLRQLEVVSPTRGWSAQVFVADSPKPTADQWGPAVAAETDADGNATFDLGGRQGGAVMVWITDLGDGSDSMAVGEVRLRGPE